MFEILAVYFICKHTVKFRKIKVIQWITLVLSTFVGTLRNNQQKQFFFAALYSV